MGNPGKAFKQIVISVPFNNLCVKNKNLKLKKKKNNQQKENQKLSLDALTNVQRHFHININLLIQERMGEDPSHE